MEHRPALSATWRWRRRGGLYKPCLAEYGGVWREQTGVATSRDLKVWTRYTGNPIIPNGAAGSLDERFASNPCVVLDGHRWVIFYYSFDKTGKARDLATVGDDPFHHMKTGQILIGVGPPGSVDSTFAHKLSVIWHEGALYHFYCAVSGKYPNEIRGISVARSRPW